MSDWTALEIAGCTAGRWIREPEHGALDFVGVSIDTRSIQPGQVFFAFAGEHTDGHDHLASAARRGAGAVVISDESRAPAGVPALLVDDPLSAITAMAESWRDRIRARVIAITGSNGKTTTCRLMEGVCKAAGKTHASPKSFNNALGVPITLLNTPTDARYLVAEVGMSTPGEIAARTRTLRPDLAVITSIGRAHLEGLGSIANIATEKSDLLRAAPPTCVGIFPGGIPELEQAIAGDTHTIARMGDGLSISNADAEGTGFTLDGAPFRVPIPGVHNASNAALCVLAARALGIDDATTRRGLANAAPPPMRFQRVLVPTHAEPIVVINDAYNANPDSMRAALSTFAALPHDDAHAGRRVVVLGEMLEMGEDAPGEHRALAAHARGIGAFDRVILLGRPYARADAGGGDDPRELVLEGHDEDAIGRAAALIAPGDAVLIKGSRGVRLERLIDKLGRIHASGRS